MCPTTTATTTTTTAATTPPATDDVILFVACPSAGVSGILRSLQNILVLAGEWGSESP